MKGVYCITNKINNKKYIGCSNDIENRWRHHKYESENKNYKGYNFPIHKAIRKYGIENFSFEILEECDNYFEREKYYIKFYNSENNNYGYNCTSGGDCGPIKKNENNGRAILSNNEVYLIRKLCLEGKMPSEVYKQFENKISLRQFQHIWRGDNWKDILPDAIEYVHSKEYISKIRKFARLCQLKGENNEY